MINTTTIKKEDIIVNSIVISGCFKGIEGEELPLKVECLENHQIVRINISKDFQKELNNYIKENDLINIKGYIEIDDLHRIIIVATKITFLSNKKAQNQLFWAFIIQL